MFVTGHTGFKGGWLCLWLKQLGAHVAGFALPPDTDPNFFDAARVGSTVHSTLGDVRDADSLTRAMSAHHPEFVIHMAAQALVLRSYTRPVETFTTNVMGTVNVLEAARFCSSVRVVLIVTSDKCYENRAHRRGYREGDPLGGCDPYSASKACAEIATESWRCSYFDREMAPVIASARAGNVLGGGDWAQDRLVPDIVRALMRNEPAEIRNPASRRPWQHVLDPLAGYLRLAQRMREKGSAYAGPWNFGPAPEEARTVRWVADLSCRLWGNGASWKTDGNPSRAKETRSLSLDATKASRMLGWRTRLTTQSAVEWTVEWYKSYSRDPGCARSLSEDQMARYQEIKKIG